MGLAPFDRVSFGMLLYLLGIVLKSTRIHRTRGVFNCLIAIAKFSITIMFHLSFSDVELYTKRNLLKSQHFKL